MIDETVLVLPESWRAGMHARRGGVPVPAPAPMGEAPAKIAAYLGTGTVDRVLDSPEQDRELAGRARAHLAGPPDAAGAAVLGAVLIGEHPGADDLFLHACVIEHGLAFAARVFAELNLLAVDRGRSSGGGVLAVRHRTPADRSVLWRGARRHGRFLRGLLAAAGEDEYAAAVEGLAGHRRTPLQRIAVSYLVPGRSDWVEECCAAPPATRGGEADSWWMLLCALGSERHLELLGGLPRRVVHADRGMIATVMEGLGPAAAPLVDAACDRAQPRAEDRKMPLEALALLPSDEAFGMLLDRIEHRYVPPLLVEAADRFPVRALRLLGAAASGTSKAAGLAGELLRAHVGAHPDLVAGVLDGLPDEARGAVASRYEAVHQVKEAAPADLPELLVTPPWERPAAEAEAAAPAAIADVPVPAETSVHWAPGERDEFAVTPYSRGPEPSRAQWELDAEAVRAGTFITWPDRRRLLLYGPDDLVRPLLADMEPPVDRALVRAIAARFGLDALPVVLRAAAKRPADHGAALVPYLGPEAAGLAAQWLTTAKAARRAGEEWIGRHGAAAVPYLVPAALGDEGADGAAARGTLRLLADRHGAEAVIGAAAANGAEATAATGAFLARDPLETLPPRIPVPGPWADPARLPRVLLRDRERALPAAATRHIVTMMAMCEYSRVYAGLDVVREICDPGSLADFSWAVFRWWRLAGGPSKDGWALAQLGVLGDDETVRRLAPLIREWPGEGGHKLAEKGLDVLAAIGTEVALMHLHGIATKVKFKGLKARAQEKVESIAADLGLSPERLGDRLVPTLGLDAAGGLTLDYGPRRFHVGFDESLKPYVTDDSGKRRKSLPKPGAKDDAELAEPAYKRFTALKKDVRTVAADQVGRLEAAMVEQRRWTADEFGKYFAGHPLVVHIARRLVWLADHAGTTTAFRIAEDRTYADVNDDPLELPETAEVRIAHPVQLDAADLAAWGEVFADYEILQPFPQLARTVHRLTEEERAAWHLARFEGLTVPSGAVVRLERHGWERGAPGDGGGQGWTSRPVPGGLSVIIDLDPGISIGMIDGIPEQVLNSVWIHERPGKYRYGTDTGRTFGELDPLTASEVLAQLTELADAAI
ncbi:DUF4132 domain-containing protein [Spirillospora sp. NPDC029432]|uniref:DUF4132 domain-containing protein n=1 Tax=Spirillospora sp. NPDC029432 TaxID=3154599 RepID=UPI003453DF10